MFGFRVSVCLILRAYVYSSFFVHFRVCEIFLCMNESLCVKFLSVLIFVCFYVYVSVIYIYTVISFNSFLLIFVDFTDTQCRRI